MRPSIQMSRACTVLGNAIGRNVDVCRTLLAASHGGMRQIHLVCRVVHRRVPLAGQPSITAAGGGGARSRRSCWKGSVTESIRAAKKATSSSSSITIMQTTAHTLSGAHTTDETMLVEGNTLLYFDTRGVEMGKTGVDSAVYCCSSCAYFFLLFFLSLFSPSKVQYRVCIEYLLLRAPLPPPARESASWILAHPKLRPLSSSLKLSQNPVASPKHQEPCAVFLLVQALTLAL